MVRPSKQGRGVTGLPSVTVVVPTYRRCGLLPLVIEPVLADPATAELVVVIDGARDGSFELTEQVARRDARVRPVLADHGGPARARQIGVEHASGEVVLLVDDDVVAGPGLVTGHAGHHAARRGLVVVGSMPVRLDGLPRRDNFAAYLYALEYERFSSAYETEPRNVLLELWGGNLSLRRDDALAVGLQAPTGRHYEYHEDRDFGLRCFRAGLTGIYDPALRAEHLHTRSLDGFLRDACHQGRDRVRLHRDHADLIGPLDIATDEAGLGPSFRLAVRLSRRRAVRAIEVPVLKLVLRAAGRAHLFRVEMRAAVILRRIEQRRAMAAGLAAPDHHDGKRH